MKNILLSRILLTLDYKKSQEKQLFIATFFVFLINMTILGIYFLYYYSNMSTTELYEKSAGGIVYRKK